MENGNALAEFAARTLDELDQDRDLPAGARLEDAILVLEVMATNDDGEPVSMVHGYVMSRRNVVGVGLAMRGLVALTMPDD